MKLYKNNEGAIYAYSNEDLENLAKQGINPIEKLSLTPFSYTPEELSAMQAAVAKQRELSEARALLEQSKSLESGVYQRKMSTDQISEFEAWQDSLLAFIDGNSETLPLTPEFINTLLRV